MLDPRNFADRRGSQGVTLMVSTAMIVDNAKAPLPVLPEALLAAFDRDISHYVVWRFEMRENKKGELKKTKVPHQPGSPGRRASAAVKGWQWDTLVEALRTYNRCGFDGVGVILADSLNPSYRDHDL